MTKFFARSLAFGLAIAGSSSLASAQSAAPALGYTPNTYAYHDAAPRKSRADDPNLPPAERVALHPYMLSLGVRAMMIRDAGYDTFSSNDSLTAFSLGAGRSVYAENSMSFAVMAFWDAGGADGDLRGEPTELFVHRVSVGPELRWHPLSDGYVLLRVSPALLNTVTSLRESSTGSAYSARSDDADLGVLSSWDFGVDLAAGVAYELFGSAGRRAGPVRFWLSGEGGYGWATSTALDWLPDEDDTSAPERVAVLDQGELGIRGPFFRFAAAATF